MDHPLHTPTASERLLRSYLDIDLRSLGLFRIGAGLLLIADWVRRWPVLEAFYCTSGLAPDAGSAWPTPGRLQLSLLAPLETLPAVRLAFVVGLAVYLCFTLGYRTRLAQLLTFAFFASLLNRNPLIRDGGDLVLLSLLAWSLFLPLGARFSLDARLGGRGARPEDATHRSLAAFAIVLQIGLIYLFSALSKWGVTWRDGSALHYALHIEELVRGPGRWLREQPQALLRASTWGTLVVEFAALPLLLSPGPTALPRRLAIVSLCGLHLGIGLTMRLGSFAATMLVSFTLLLTAADWSLLQRALRRALGGRAAIPAAAGSPMPAAGARRRPSWGSLASTVAALLLLGAVVVDGYNQNVARRSERLPRLRLPPPMAALIEVPQLHQDWRLFSPDPARVSTRWIVEAHSPSGDPIDLGRRSGPDLDPLSIDRWWRKYLSRLDERRPQDWPRLARYFQERERAFSGRAPASISFFLHTVETAAPGTSSAGIGQRTLVWSTRSKLVATQQPIQR